MTREETIAILVSEAGRDETRRIYQLRRTIELVERTIYARHVTRGQAEQLADRAARLAEDLFPGSAETFAIVYGRRLKRVIDEVFGAAN